MLKKYHFCYGAILNAIFENNEDAIPTLLEATDKHGVYKILTNTSKREYVIFCKYAFQKENKSDNYKSWTFKFSEDEKKCLKSYYDKGFPVFIYFLCAIDDLAGSLIAVCTYEEFSVVKDKQSITIGKEKNMHSFNLHTEKQRSTSIQLKSNRIKKKSDDIIDELVNFSPEHYQKQFNPNIKIIIANNKPCANENSALKNRCYYLSINYGENETCPIHNLKMSPMIIHMNDLEDTAYFCEKCNKLMISGTKYQNLIKRFNKPATNTKDIKFEIIDRN